MTNLQMILALGAFVILSMIILRVNKNSMEVEDVFYDSGFGILATSIATSVIEDATHNHFDSTTDTMWTNDLTKLTPTSKLGRETGEDVNDTRTFNDIDDFHGYTKVDSSMPSAIFKVKCSVCYVDEAHPNVPVTGPTWHKKISVIVTSDYMQDTIRQSSIFSYWSF